MPQPADELVDLTQKLLVSIATGDWKTYEQLCDVSLTAFEPEGRGHLIHGLPFHKFYFDLGAAKKPPQNSIGQPHVRMCGDVGIVSYARLTQVLDENGRPITKVAEETRVWQRVNGTWKHIHFHRSLPA